MIFEQLSRSLSHSAYIITSHNPVTKYYHLSNAKCSNIFDTARLALIPYNKKITTRVYYSLHRHLYSSSIIYKSWIPLVLVLLHNMKDHMRKYFPERFNDEQSYNLRSKMVQLLMGANPVRQRSMCELKVEEVFKKSNELKLLAGAMKKYGCNFRLSRHVACEFCNNCNGGFDPDTNQIVMCVNSGLTDNRVMAIMMHEMIHMFDYCRAKFDFNNLEHVACSEIRAANLTYCSLTDRLKFGGTGWFDFKKTHKYCVQDVAYRSVKAYSPETEDSKIWDIVNKVFPVCYNDLEPFGRRPTSGSEALKQSYRERYYYGYVY